MCAHLLMVFLAPFLFVALASGTSIVVLVGPRYIVVGADGAVVNFQGGKPLPSTTGDKIVAIHGRIAVASAGLESFTSSTPAMSYRFTEAIQEAESSSASEVTVTQMAEAIRVMLARRFQGFENLLQSGALKPEDFPPPGTNLLEYVVAGYESGEAYAYRINLDIDWPNRRLLEPRTTRIFPDARAPKNLALYWVGRDDRGIVELRDPNSEVFRKAALDMPIEMDALRNNKPLEPTTMRLFACKLLEIEANRAPRGTVGFPMSVTTILQGGGASMLSFPTACRD